MQSCGLSILDDLIIRDSNPGRLRTVSSWPSARFILDLQLRQLTTFQPIQVKRFAVALWKDLNLLKNTLLSQKTGSIFKMFCSLKVIPYPYCSCYRSVMYFFPTDVIT